MYHFTGISTAFVSQLTGNMFGSYGYANNCSVLDLSPGRYFCTTTVSDLPTNDFWFVEIVSFIPNELDRIIRAYDPVSKKSAVIYRINNVWTSWQTYVTTSDLAYVDCEVDTVANNQIAISNAPVSNKYIPVVLEHSTNNLVREHIYRSGGEWRIFSDYAQKTIIRFYKYPV